MERLRQRSMVETSQHNIYIKQCNSYFESGICGSNVNRVEGSKDTFLQANPHASRFAGRYFLIKEGHCRRKVPNQRRLDRGTCFRHGGPGHSTAERDRVKKRAEVHELRKITHVLTRLEEKCGLTLS